MIANLISGGIDEIFTRADSTGDYTPLTDALGSTIALVDASGNLVTQYAYDPFGNTTVSGASNSNRFQYTGRENEGNGLYFYRGRYYSPLLGRFINEDPLRFGGGDANLYAYVGNDPIDFLDPFGTNALPSPATIGQIAAGAGRAALKLLPKAIPLGESFGAEVATGATATALGVGCLVVLDVGLSVYDGVQVYHLGQAYGWWGQPEKAPAPTLAGRYTGKKRRKWNDDDCEVMLQSDTQFCNSLPKPADRAACHAQASERYASCLAGTN
jgi:RHS repeat-associated protein